MTQRRGSDRTPRAHHLTGEDGVRYSSSPEEGPSPQSSASSVDSDCVASDEDTQRWVRSAARAHQYLACKGSPSPLPAGACGLENLGNTCYMNAVLQVLAHTEGLVNYVVSGLYREDLSASASSRGGGVAEEVAQLLAVMWSRRFRFVSPHRLRAAVAGRRVDMGGSRQQDAHECILLLLQWLHEDLNVAARPAPAAPPPVAGLRDFEAAERAWRQFRREHDSIVARLFHGLQKSALVCAACGFESASFETFSLLSLPLPAGAAAARGSLYHCLEQYILGDLVTDWSCPKCRRRHDAYSKLDIWRLPPVVILHLKRFTFSGSGLRKAHGQVSFPLRDLDLSQLAVGPHPETHSLVYDLYAVVEHHGSPYSGHYTAFCLNQPAARWFFIDDVTVREAAAAKVKDASAYMLCYAAREIS